MNKPKILLLFGAGASTGSGGTNKITPLGRNIFSCLCKEFPNTWGNKIKGELKKKFVENFEAGMDSLYKTPKELHFEVAPLLVELSIFFSKFNIIAQNNLYVKLFRKFELALRNRDIIISTLNYECLVEYALHICQIDVDYCGNYLGSRLFKLHGSCNFIPQNFTGGGPGLSFDIGSGTINTPIKIVKPENVEAEFANIPIPAAMSLYTHEKRNIISPDIIKKIIKDFEVYTREVQNIIVIGIKPTPEIDTHIWNPLQSTKANVVLVGNEESCKDWISKYKKGRSDYVGSRFKDCFDQICDLMSRIVAT
jgi:hypothetical protein